MSDMVCVCVCDGDAADADCEDAMSRLMRERCELQAQQARVVKEMKCASCLATYSSVSPLPASTAASLASSVAHSHLGPLYIVQQLLGRRVVHTDGWHDVTAVKLHVWVSSSVSSVTVCLCVRTLKGKQLELSVPNLVDIR